MKREKSLMIAYIVFIFICAIVRFLTIFPRWYALVAAITITSGLFSFADFFNTCAHEWRGIAQENGMYSEKTIPDIERMLKAMDVLFPKFEAGLIGQSPHLKQETIDQFLLNKEAAQTTLVAYQNMAEKVDRDKQFADIYERIAALLTVVGFIFFFVILTFEPIGSSLINSQDVITVVSFGLILLSRYLEDMSSTKRKKRQKDYDAVKNGWEALRKSFELEESHYAD